MNKLYVIKIGKMYIKDIDVSEYDAETEFIYNIEFTSDKTDVYLKPDEKEANYIIDKLYKVFKIYIDGIIEMEEV